MGLYDNIGTNYNITRKADPFIASRLFHNLKDNIFPGSKFLDVGCGTGNYTIQLAAKGLDFIGVDPSELMLSEAKQKCRTIRWCRGSAEVLPFNPLMFDAVISTLSIHHWQNFRKGMENIYSVLKRSGQFLIFTSTKEQMNQYWLNEYFPEMMKESIAQMPSYQRLKKTASQVGFKIVKVEKYFIQDDLQDLFLYSGKNNPFIYFNNLVRNGISSFAKIAKENEIVNGLVKLRHDLLNGNFNKVKQRFTDNCGDYMFILFTK